MTSQTFVLAELVSAGTALHGRELTRRLRAKIQGWQRTAPSTISRALKKLEEEGLVKRESAENGNRNQRPYLITKKGIRECGKMLEKSLHYYQPGKNPFDTGIQYLDLLNRDSAEGILSVYHKKFEGAVNGLKTRIADAEQKEGQANEAIRYETAMKHAESDWGLVKYHLKRLFRLLREEVPGIYRWADQDADFLEYGY